MLWQDGMAVACTGASALQLVAVPAVLSGGRLLLSCCRCHDEHPVVGFGPVDTHLHVLAGSISGAPSGTQPAAVL